MRIVCAIALLAIATGAARSQDRACKWFQWGFGFFKVEAIGHPDEARATRVLETASAESMARRM
jgi:hypothetical protein